MIAILPRFKKMVIKITMCQFGIAVELISFSRNIQQVFFLKSIGKMIAILPRFEKMVIKITMCQFGIAVEIQ